jgi:hypothetical protein
MPAPHPSRYDRLAIVACGPDEWHDLGLLMVALFLTRRGWHVLYLGASLPRGELEQYLPRLRPNAVVLSASTESVAVEVAEIVRGLAALPPPMPVIGYGGLAFETSPPAARGRAGAVPRAGRGVGGGAAERGRCQRPRLTTADLPVPSSTRP